MSRQVSQGSAGEYQADEQAGVAVVVAPRIFLVVCRIFFSCDMWDLVLRPGIEPRPPALGV